MRRIGARPLVGVVLTLLVGCGAAAPKPEHSPTSQPAAKAAPAIAYVPMQRDLYTRRLVYLLRHGWRTPATLDASPMSLKTMAELELDAHGQFVRYRLSKSSGSEPFDSSVAGHLQALIDSGARAERGPPYIVDHVFGEMLTVLFQGPPPPGTPPY
jgi:hypothetical protein